MEWSKEPTQLTIVTPFNQKMGDFGLKRPSGHAGLDVQMMVGSRWRRQRRIVQANDWRNGGSEEIILESQQLQQRRRRDDDDNKIDDGDDDDDNNKQTTSTRLTTTTEQRHRRRQQYPHVQC